MAKKKVFVSFDYEDDRNYRALLNAWDANPEFDFYMSDMTPGEIDTWDISRIKAALTASINKSTYTLVIIGKNANKYHANYRGIGFRNWINFEIYKSKLNRNKLIGVKIDREYEIPEELNNSGAEWAMSFTKESIILALERASKK